MFAIAEAAPTQVPIDFTTTSSNDITTKLFLELLTSLRKQDYIVIPDASPEKQDDATQRAPYLKGTSSRSSVGNARIATMQSSPHGMASSFKQTR